MLGMVYALIAVGYSLVFGILRLLNMAHGSIYAFGAHMALFAVSVNWGFRSHSFSQSSPPASWRCSWTA